eukprot:160751-Pyramimonas_sp.AAC.1
MWAIERTDSRRENVKKCIINGRLFSVQQCCDVEKKHPPPSSTSGLVRSGKIATLLTGENRRRQRNATWPSGRAVWSVSHHTLSGWVPRGDSRGYE